MAEARPEASWSRGGAGSHPQGDGSAI